MCSLYGKLNNIVEMQAHYSTGAVAAGFTSTIMDPKTHHEPGNFMMLCCDNKTVM